MSELNKIVLERINYLPQIIQDAITQSNWPEKLRLICNKHGVLLDQANVIENAVLMAMVGVIHPDKLIDELKEEGINHTKSVEIINDINEQIFSPIKKDLVDTFNAFEEAEQILETEKEDGEDNSLDFLAGNLHETAPGKLHQQDETEDREAILKAIEDKEETPAPQTNIAQKQAGPVSNAPAPVVAPTNILNKLTQTQTSSPQNVKIDPYREPVK